MKENKKNSLVSFQNFLDQEKQKQYFQKLMQLLAKEYKNEVVFPKKEEIFRSLKLCNFSNLKLVIVGQDPYHDFNQADGLAFSTRLAKLPPSLKNIFSEIKASYPNFNKTNGNLENWAKQGVLLQNLVLSVRKSQPGSHYFLNWDQFSINLFKFIVENRENIIFLLLGKKAQTILKHVDLSQQKVFALSHPSPFSFQKSLKNSNVFKQINDFLEQINKDPINWNL
ncbi:uracil-DNA glycosylase [Mesomycoplasma conjunctivae]|uniref:Uracil-DNA glycosylase n=1 Tax=Mesomycoplasma conjunctivae (strain ATCC 25834 / NCTC 10147 / HRC/581) TaxID=572263 RepID=C5J5Y9_MESCH|nr:uracil-DNA glycosylase [Mesomycoplasma conjunctivae]CAT04881.1 Uracil-DNA glycosylase [Mesomycoplasma conjunctivae]VEU65972.1 uracil-DNA glycosylase [Mesomycoplasma conjunctivae]